MKKIGVYTNNFSLYHDLLAILKDRKIPYVSLQSNKNISNKISVIITSKKELHSIKFKKIIAADNYNNLNQVVDVAIQMTIGKDQYFKVIFGIDPGEKPGIAIVADDILLKKTNENTPENIIKSIKRYLKEYHSINTLIRIGDGSLIYRNRIINELLKLDIPIELVNEKKTTINQKKGRHNKDSEAAAKIALIEGKKVQKKQSIRITRGDIKRIQEESRRVTEGKFSISEKTAISVLKGKISLIDAVESEQFNKKPKHL